MGVILLCFIGIVFFDILLWEGLRNVIKGRKGLLWGVVRLCIECIILGSYGYLFILYILGIVGEWLLFKMCLLKYFSFYFIIVRE